MVSTRKNRIRMKVPVRVRRSVTGEIFEGMTMDVSPSGVSLMSLEKPVEIGEILEVHCADRRAAFWVVWLGRAGTSTEGQAGMECLNPEANIWKLEKAEQPEGLPLVEEISAARGVQNRLLPRERPHLQTLDYSGSCVPARAVGGDYYDFLDLGPGQVGFVLADVAGKGVGAALLMANLQGSIHSQDRAFGAQDLPGVLASVNRNLYKHTDAEHYASLFCGHYDDRTRSLRYVNCGHNPPLLLRKHGTVERLVPTAMVLGVFGEWQCSVGETRLDEGDVLTVYTDGIIEARGESGEEFGEARLLGTLEESRSLESDAILRKVEQAVEQFRVGEREDDLTLLIARAQ